LRGAATELGAFDVQLIAQGPQQRHLRLDIEAVVFTVDIQFHDGSLLVHCNSFALWREDPFYATGKQLKFYEKGFSMSHK
jgi:hypothetical protein